MKPHCSNKTKKVHRIEYTRRTGCGTIVHLGVAGYVDGTWLGRIQPEDFDPVVVVARLQLGPYESMVVNATQRCECNRPKSTCYM